MSSIHHRMWDEHQKEAARDIYACLSCMAEHTCQCICNNTYSYQGQAYEATQILGHLSPSSLQEEDIRAMMNSESMWIDGDLLRRVS